MLLSPIFDIKLINKRVLGISGESWSGQVMAFCARSLEMTSGSEKVTVLRIHV